MTGWTASSIHYADRRSKRSPEKTADLPSADLKFSPYQICLNFVTSLYVKQGITRRVLRT